MKERYERAKKEGLNWQVLIISDCETDIKAYLLKAVLDKEKYAVVNEKVGQLIKDCISDLASEEVKTMARNSLYMFASRTYISLWATLGTKDDEPFITTLLLASGVKPTEKVIASVNALKEFNPLQAELKGEKYYNRAVANNLYDKEYANQLRQRLNGIMTSTAKTDYSEYSSLRASAERQIRYEWHLEQIESMKAKTNLAWIDTHSNCSERCQPFQGRLYSLDGTSGKTKEGYNYVPLEVATDIYETTKAGIVYKNGCLSGFGCKHRLIIYKGKNKPETIPSEVIEKQREIDRKMREMERTIRQYEALALTYKGRNAKLYGHYKNLVTVWAERYGAFARDNGVAVIPSRIDI